MDAKVSTKTNTITNTNRNLFRYISFQAFTLNESNDKKFLMEMTILLNTDQALHCLLIGNHSTGMLEQTRPEFLNQ